MAQKYYQSFKITAAANSEVADGGLESTGAEPKKIVGILLHVTGQAGNIVKGYIEREKIVDLYDYHLSTDENTGGVNMQKTTNRLQFIEINVELPVGRTFNAAIACGATAKDVYGSYVYELGR